MNGLAQYNARRYISKRVDLDKFNLDWDGKLSFAENKTILEPYLTIGRSPQERIEKGLYTAQDAAQDEEMLGLAQLRNGISKPLTDKQNKVLSLLLGGSSQRQVAKTIGKSRSAVRKHFNALKKKGYASKVGYNRYVFMPEAS